MKVMWLHSFIFSEFQSIAPSGNIVLSLSGMILIYIVWYVRNTSYVYFEKQTYMCIKEYVSITFMPVIQN